MDEYLIPEASKNRLIEEYEKYGCLYVGYDFDNTVYDYHGVGASYEMVRQLLRDLKSLNCKLICWTAQNDLTFVEQYLTENDIPFDGINTDGVPLKWETRKPHFSALLDDRAGLLQVYTELRVLVNKFKHKQNAENR